MALTVYEESNISAIADKIREKTSGTATYTTEEMPDGVSEVYEAGKKAEYDAFWDNYQNYGKRTTYYFGFSCDGWTPETFKPKYPIRADVLLNAFAYWGYNLTQKIDMREACVLDTSQCSNLNSIFYNNTLVSGIGTFDTRSCTTFTSCFSGCKSLEIIEKFILKDDGSQTCNNNLFYGCEALTSITFEGLIGTDFDIHWSPLTYDSILSVITHLSDTKTGQTLTLSKAAVNKAFETTTSANDGSTSPEWLALVATKQNWTISLV